MHHISRDKFIVAEDHSSSGSAESIALVFACLGWVTFGLLAIPGVIIAHCLKSSGVATPSTSRATFIVGYSIIGIMSSLFLAPFILTAVIRHQAAETMSREPLFSRGTEATSYPSGIEISNPGLWLAAGAGVAILIAMPFLITRLRSLQMKAQSARIMRMNRNR